jgi:large subunit ribosomal protein L17
MLRNMVTSLFREERLTTTIPRAKEARRVAERVITFAKRGDIHARRQAARVVRDTEVLQKLFAELGPRYADRPGGYTRILKTGYRVGDNAPMSILELVGTKVPVVAESEEPAAEAKKGRGRKSAAGPAGPAVKEPKAKKPKGGPKPGPKASPRRKSNTPKTRGKSGS